jgi:lipoprotein signal peptidase
MKKISKTRIILILICGFFLLLDQFLKYQALNNWSDKFLLNKFLGWQPFLNNGIAFGIPLPNIFTIAITIPILIVILILLIKEKNIKNFLAFALIFYGAYSNLRDRIFFDSVVDYFLIFTSLINLADVMIVVGLVLLLWGKIKRK